jgi:hypothetical protein
LEISHKGTSRNLLALVWIMTMILKKNRLCLVGENNQERLESALEEGRSPTVFLDVAKQCIKYPGIAGARLRKGTLSSRDHDRLGDSILMNFSKAFFAVSDSSARSPKASHEFLLRLNKVLDDNFSFHPEILCTSEKLDKIKNDLTRRAEVLFNLTPRGESCTLTGVHIVRTRTGTKGILFHIGDSFLFQLVPKTGEFKQITKNNVWMVGRSKRFFQVEVFEIKQGTVLILSTDGFSDLNFLNHADRNEFVVKLAGEYPVEDLPDKILENIGGRKTPVDDIGIIFLYPDQLISSELNILMGE